MAVGHGAFKVLFVIEAVADDRVLVLSFLMGLHAIRIAIALGIACALERYRLAKGNYPETLDVLMPMFISKLPHDVINGQPLKYHRSADGTFVLYSVGWNETDDGGEVVRNVGEDGKERAVDQDKGDWVWRYPAN